MPSDDLVPIVEATYVVLREVQCDRQCVPASAILLKVLHRHNYPDAYPLSVRAEILNKAMHKHIERHGRGADHALPHDALGSIVGNPPGSPWSGHMGIVVPKHVGERHAFLDLTISQGNAPSRGINLDPLCLYVGDDFVTGKEPHRAEFNGCHITYTAFPNDHNYDNGSNWMKMPGLEKCVDMVIERLYG